MRALAIFRAPVPRTTHSVRSDRATVGVRIYLASGGPPPHSLPSEEVEEYLRGCRADVALRVLSTMSVRPLRLKAIKSLKIPKAQQSSMRLWMVMQDGHFVVIDEEYAGRDLSWWGVEEGTIFVLAASEA